MLFIVNKLEGRMRVGHLTSSGKYGAVDYALKDTLITVVKQPDKT